MKTTVVISLLFLIIFGQVVNAQEKQRELGQPVLMALAASNGSSDPLTIFKEDVKVQAITTAINQVLVERKLEVRDLKQQVANFDRLRAKMGALQGDPNAMLAASSGADIYLEFAYELIKEGPGTKIRIDINVKESATAKLLGASSGQSDAVMTNDLSSLSQIALNNCIERVMEQVRGYWSDMPTSGKPIIITISSATFDLNKPTPNGKRIDRELTGILKANTISYRREMSTNKTLQFNPVYVDIRLFDDIEEFSYKLQDLFDTFGLTYDAQVEGKSIEINIQ